MVNRIFPLGLFKPNCGGFGPSSFVNFRAIYLVGGEAGDGLACAILSIGEAIIGDKVYVRMQKEYGSPEFLVWSPSKNKSLTGPPTAPRHVEKDLWVIGVTEAAEDGHIILYSYPTSPPKMYTGVGLNMKPLPRFGIGERIGATISRVLSRARLAFNRGA